MQHGHHGHRLGHAARPQQRESLNDVAAVATLHCLLGCAIGEVAGLVIGTSLGWSDLQTIALAVALAFVSGFALTAVPFLRRGYSWPAALRIALAADAASIAIMEIVDNAVMFLIPGAMAAPVLSVYFLASMALALVVAGVVAYPVNRWLIARGRGHAMVHAQHHRPNGGGRSLSLRSTGQATVHCFADSKADWHEVEADLPQHGERPAGF